MTIQANGASFTVSNSLPITLNPTGISNGNAHFALTIDIGAEVPKQQSDNKEADVFVYDSTLLGPGDINSISSNNYTILPPKDPNVPGEYSATLNQTLPLSQCQSTRHNYTFVALYLDGSHKLNAFTPNPATSPNAGIIPVTLQCSTTYPNVQGPFTGCFQANGNYSPAPLSLSLNNPDSQGNFTGSINLQSTTPVTDTISGKVSPLVASQASTVQITLDHYAATFTATVALSGNAAAFVNGTYAYNGTPTGTWHAAQTGTYC